MTLLRLQHAAVIDGTGRPPQPDTLVVVRGDRIAYVGPEAAWAPPPDEPAAAIDLTGRYLLPGLIDCHVHLACECLPDSTLQGPLGWTTLVMLRHAQNTLAAGFTSVRDVGGRHFLEFSLRRALEAGWFAGPRLQLAGKLLSITSTGSEWYDGMYREADGPDEVRKAAREQLKAGADLIKVLATGAVLAPGEQPGAVQFGVDELRAAVEEAEKVGKSVAAHAHGLQGIRNAVQAGARTIEHGTYLHQDPRLMETMAERGVFLIPTLKAGFDVIAGDRPGIPPWIIEKSKEVQEDALLSVRRALAMGVPIALGTDAATPYNFHGENALELVYMAEAGLSPMQAIVAATRDAARALGWADRLGTLEAGKLADLIVVKRDPLADLKSLADRRNIEYVMQGGRFVAREFADARGIPEAAMAGAWVCCGLPGREI